VKFWGVGGMEVHAPMASFWFGGTVGRRVRRDVAGSIGCLWTYWILLVRIYCAWEQSVRYVSCLVESTHVLSLGDVMCKL